MGLLDEVLGGLQRMGTQPAPPVAPQPGQMSDGPRADGYGTDSQATSAGPFGNSPIGAILGSLLGARGAQAGGGLGGMLAGAGGLTGLTAMLQQAGLGDVVRSWIERGGNKPISPGQLGDALGDDRVTDMARQSGMEKGDLLHQLSQMLPGVVDQLTPEGRLPTQQELHG